MTLRVFLLPFVGLCAILGVTSLDWKIPDYRTHPCLRDCKDGAQAMTCKYEWIIEWYYTMAKACHNCPFNATDCARLHCVPADGAPRAIMTANRMMPGPAIHVCEGDHIEVRVSNRLQNGESTSIHWHGIHQKGTPYMDGVAGLTQCPITPYTSFEYKFRASQPGTNYWHSHSGLQRADGLYGALVVRQSPSNELQKGLYDYDLPEHVMLVTDWLERSTVNKFAGHHHAGFDNKPESMLVNGKGVYKQFQEPSGQSTTYTYTPREVMKVQKGYAYRFRMISNGIMNAPIRVSIDNHRMTLIASDGAPFQPVIVDYFIIYAGERWDFVVNASQSVGNYWINMKGLLDGKPKKSHTTAILRYKGAPESNPAGNPSYDTMTAAGVNVNPLNKASTAIDMGVETLVSLKPAKETDPIAKEKADRKFFLAYDFYRIDNMVFHNRDLYSVYSLPKNKHLYSPQINHIASRFPSAPLLSQPDDVSKEDLCNYDSIDQAYCKKNYCECAHTLDVKLGEVVEIFLVDEGVTYNANHPFHLHGYNFRVVAMGKINSSVSLDYIKQLDREGKIKRNLTHSTLKDTVTVADGGYTVIRFHATNPGYWLFHCHLAFHSQIGMSVVIKVGESSDSPPVPAGFPKCGNYKNIGAPKPTTAPPTSGGKNYKLSTFLLFLIIVYFA